MYWAGSLNIGYKYRCDGEDRDTRTRRGVCLTKKLRREMGNQVRGWWRGSGCSQIRDRSCDGNTVESRHKVGMQTWTLEGEARLEGSLCRVVDEYLR